MKTKNFILLAAIALFSSFIVTTNAHAVDPEKKKVIKELLDVSGADQIAIMMGDASSKNITMLLRKQNPDTPSRVFDAIDQEVKKVFEEEMESGSFYELIYPIYAEKFSLDELKEILAFYKTPVGQKVTKELPAITQEAMMKGQVWGQSMGPKLQKRIQQRMQEEGL